MQEFDEIPYNQEIPLVEHLQGIAEDIEERSALPENDGEIITITIIVSGLPTDGEAEDVLRMFERLPVYIVIRLCTTDSNVIQQWRSVVANDYDHFAEVIFDLYQEATAKHRGLPWFTYGEPLHRMRCSISV